MANNIMKWAGRIFLLCLILIGFMIYSVNIANDDSPARRMKVRQLKEEIRQRKRAQLREDIFKYPLRPEGYVYNLDVNVSEHTPLIRDVEDTRDAKCLEIKYNRSKLPKFSLITPIYNEALSMVLRMVHSFLRKSPPELLQEIILIDDNSKNEDLKAPLEQYVRLLPKVKLLRTKKREGLIRARLIGAKIAKGPVIMFVDAHTEANAGWAEPLLDEIRKDPKKVLQPSLDHINTQTIMYEASSGDVPRGGFSWDLRFVWMEIPEHEKKRVTSEIEPFRSATLVGCAIMVDKEYFRSIGAFDDAMNVWGGENIELAFRTWLCGGQVLTVPCSKVAHAFKEFSYSFDGDKEIIVTRNLMRIAELWMDDYKKYFYASTYNYKFKRTYLREIDQLTLQRRKLLKEKLQCKPFEWYLKTIVPEIPIPPLEAVYYGEVANFESRACLYVTEDNYIGMTYYCFIHRVLPGNIFHIDQHSLMMYGENCVLIDKKTWLLYVGECPDTPESEHWEVQATGDVVGYLRVTVTIDGQEQTYCLCQVTNVATPHKGQQMPQAMPCDTTNKFMQWTFSYRFHFDYNFDPPAVEL